ncbi:hypothetical protein [uncultured Bradyrhizobium sp.]|uniref:hypothetical protein n=1 Tax=uncultured Bradyrhizobium sp. TaxID=199684 RepID=UPI0035CA06F0
MLRLFRVKQSFATSTHFAVVAVVDEFLPRPPASRAVESPCPDGWTRKKQRPARSVRQLDAMCVGRRPKLEVSGRVFPLSVHSACGDGVLRVFAVEQDRTIQPRMIVQRPIIVRPKELVQIDIEETIARYHPPSAHIRLLRTSDQEVGRARVRDTFEKLKNLFHLFAAAL